MQEKILRYSVKVLGMDYLRTLIQQNKGTRLGQVIYTFSHMVYDILLYFEAIVLYLFFRPFPLRRQVVATTFNGIKYGDNPQFIYEQLHQDYPNLRLVWIQDKNYSYKVPDYVDVCTCSMGLNAFRRYAAYYTSKVWIDTHHIDKHLIKRSEQFFIETWHGGLGIKKIEGDAEKYINNRFQMERVRATCKKADIFISNSKHLEKIYRSAFGYSGQVWTCGYPKNDCLVYPDKKNREKVCLELNIPSECKIVLYAPTFRKSVEIGGEIIEESYKIDIKTLIEKLYKIHNSKWIFVVRWHPFMVKALKKKNIFKGEHVYDATLYPDIQELILACDIFISDYSSCIFDAALAGKRCFIYARDFDEYINERGLYYDLKDLPFPVAMNDKELIDNILSFSMEKYIVKWEEFKRITGLYESGHASKDIAHLVGEFIQS